MVEQEELIKSERLMIEKDVKLTMRKLKEQQDILDQKENFQSKFGSETKNRQTQYLESLLEQKNKEIEKQNEQVFQILMQSPGNAQISNLSSVNQSNLSFDLNDNLTVNKTPKNHNNTIYTNGNQIENSLYQNSSIGPFKKNNNETSFQLSFRDQSFSNRNFMEDIDCKFQDDAIIQFTDNTEDIPNTQRQQNSPKIIQLQKQSENILKKHTNSNSIKSNQTEDKELFPKQLIRINSKQINDSFTQNSLKSSIRKQSSKNKLSIDFKPSQFFNKHDKEEEFLSKQSLNQFQIASYCKKSTEESQNTLSKKQLLERFNIEKDLPPDFFTSRFQDDNILNSLAKRKECHYLNLIKRRTLNFTKQFDFDINIGVQDLACKTTYVDKNENNLKLKIKELLVKRLKFFHYSLVYNLDMMPDKTINVIWDVFLAFFSIAVIFLESLKIFFWVKNKDDFPTNISEIKNFIMLIFIIDILKNFLTGYYEKGTLIRDPNKISTHYFKTNFIYDFTSLIAFLISTKRSLDNTALSNYTRVFFFVKSFAMKVIFERIQQKFTFDPSKKHVMKLCKVLIAIIFLAHFSACGFFSLGKVEYYYLGYEQTWLDIGEDFNLLDTQVFIQYTYSYFWASCLMIQSLVYMPINILETWYTTFVMFFTCIIIAYVINVIGEVIKDMHKKVEMFDQDLDIINEYMIKKGLPSDLQFRVRNYLKYLHFEEQQKTTADEQNVLIKMSNNLRKDITKDVNSKHLKNIPIISQRFSEKTIQKVIFIMEEFSLGAQELIFDKNDHTNDLYYIANGDVEIFIDTHKDQKVLKRLSEKQTFNELAFFTGQKDEILSIRSQGCATIYRISQEDFRSSIDTEDDLEIYNIIKEELILNKRARLYEINCTLCGQYDHCLNQCDTLQYYPNPWITMQNFIIEGQLTQSRKRYLRSRDMVKIKSLLFLQYIDVQSEIIEYLLMSQQLDQSDEFYSQKSLSDSNISIEVQECKVQFGKLQITQQFKKKKHNEVKKEQDSQISFIKEEEDEEEDLYFNSQESENSDIQTVIQRQMQQENSQSIQKSLHNNYIMQTSNMSNGQEYQSFNDQPQQINPYLQSVRRTSKKISGKNNKIITYENGTTNYISNKRQSKGSFIRSKEISLTINKANKQFKQQKECKFKGPQVSIGGIQPANIQNIIKPQIQPQGQISLAQQNQQQTNKRQSLFQKINMPTFQNSNQEQKVQINDMLQQVVGQMMNQSNKRETRTKQTNFDEDKNKLFQSFYQNYNDQSVGDDELDPKLLSYFLNEFEKMHIFKQYFTKSNFPVILNNLQQIQRQHISNPQNQLNNLQLKKKLKSSRMNDKDKIKKMTVHILKNSLQSKKNV